MSRVLVTGGAGYIGSHTVEVLRARGDHVVVLDTLEHGHPEAVGDTPLVVGSTADRALVAKVIAEHRIDSIVHFAAHKAAGESMRQPGRYFENNVVGTLSLLQAAVDGGVRRLVFSSTAAVYGAPQTLPVKEDAPLRPENPYGESKLIVEQMLKWFDAGAGLKSVALRYFNAAGAALDGHIGEDPRDVQNLVPIVMNVATGRTPKLQVFGDDYPTPDGTAVRDYIHVLDLAEAHARALDFLTEHGRSDVFNLGTGQGYSVKQIIDTAKRISGVDFRVEFAPRRPGDAPAIWADNTKARAALRWIPQHGIETIIGSARKWSSTHPNGFA